MRICDKHNRSDRDSRKVGVNAAGQLQDVITAAGIRERHANLRINTTQHMNKSDSKQQAVRKHASYRRRIL
jgi:hypothetical protein